MTKAREVGKLCSAKRHIHIGIRESINFIAKMYCKNEQRKDKVIGIEDHKNGHRMIANVSTQSILTLSRACENPPNKREEKIYRLYSIRDVAIRS